MSARNFFDRKKLTGLSPSTMKSTKSKSEGVADSGTSGTYMDDSEEKTKSLPRMEKGKSTSSEFGRRATLEAGAKLPSVEDGEDSSRKLKFPKLSKRLSFKNLGSYFGRKHRVGESSGSAVGQSSEENVGEDRGKKLDYELNYEALENELHSLFKSLKGLSQYVAKDDLPSLEVLSSDADLPLDKLRNIVTSCKTVVNGLDSKWRDVLLGINKLTIDDLPPPLPDQPSPAETSVIEETSEVKLSKAPSTSTGAEETNGRTYEDVLEEEEEAVVESQ
jgi:hypothetical protein